MTNYELYHSLLAYLEGRLLLDDTHRLYVSQRLKDNIKWFSGQRKILLGWLNDDQIKELSNAVKCRLQSEANEAHKSLGRWGMICMATGTGKSKTAIDAVYNLIKYNPLAKVLVVSPTTKLRDKTWKQEFSQWNMEDAWKSNVRSECYKSLSKINDCEFDFVILDEVHNLTENYAKFFKNNKVKACMGLTATKPDNKVKALLLEQLNLREVYEITLDEAVSLGVVAPYEITVILTKLDNSRKYVKAGRKDKPFYQTEQANYQYYSHVENHEDPSIRKRVGKFFYINRMKFIYNLMSKTEAAQDIINRIPESLRTLIFCGSIEQAEKLCPYRYHSKTGDKDYEAFFSEKINRMSCVEAVNEGHNIPNVDVALVVQLNSNALDLIQRIGRIIRFKAGHIGKIVIICVENTVDEKWMRSATKDLDQNKIRFLNWDSLLSGSETLTF